MNSESSQVIGDSFSDVERAVMALQLEGSLDDAFIRLRKQFEASEVVNRMFSGVGFFTEMRVVDSSNHLPDAQSYELGDVGGISMDLKNGVGFVLFVRYGILFALEGFTYDELWPHEGTDLVLSNYKTGQQQTVVLEAVPVVKTLKGFE